MLYVWPGSLRQIPQTKNNTANFPAPTAVARLFRGGVFGGPTHPADWSSHVAHILPPSTKSPASDEAGYSASLHHSAGTQDDRAMALLFLDFRFQHHRCGARNAAVFAHAPEMQRHENAGDQRNRDAVPDVGAQQRVGVDDRSAKQGEAHIVVRRHPKERAE